jgi:hypothetical protein
MATLRQILFYFVAFIRIYKRYSVCKIFCIFHSANRISEPQIMLRMQMVSRLDQRANTFQKFLLAIYKCTAFFFIAFRITCSYYIRLPFERLLAATILKFSKMIILEIKFCNIMEKSLANKSSRYILNKPAFLFQILQLLHIQTSKAHRD